MMDENTERMSPEQIAQMFGQKLDDQDLSEIDLINETIKLLEDNKNKQQYEYTVEIK